MHLTPQNGDGDFYNGASHTCVDQKLVCESRVVDVVDGRGEDCGHHLQRREHTLQKENFSSGGNLSEKLEAEDAESTWN